MNGCWQYNLERTVGLGEGAGTDLCWYRPAPVSRIHSLAEDLGLAWAFARAAGNTRSPVRVWKGNSGTLLLTCRELLINNGFIKKYGEFPLCAFLWLFLATVS